MILLVPHYYCQGVGQDVGSTWWQFAVLLVIGGLSKGTVQEMVTCFGYFLTCWIFAVAKQLRLDVVAVEMMAAAACCTHPVTSSHIKM